MEQHTDEFLETYIDLEILAKMKGCYLVMVEKESLNALASYDKCLVVRHWDGEKPVVLERYGDDAVRTREDSSKGNNLTALPTVDENALKDFVKS